MKKYFLILTTLVSLVTAAQEPAKPEPSPDEKPKEEKTLWEKTKDLGKKAIDKGAEVAEKVEKSYEDIPNRRNVRDTAITGSYSYFDFWTFGKMGIAGSWQNSERSYDLEYQQGSLGYGLSLADLGKFSENRIHFVKRSYAGRNTFNWYYGPYYNQFKFEFGDKIMNTISNAYPHSEYLNIETIGLVLGIGNRWQFENGFTIGVDWFEINWPLIILKKEAAMLDSNASESDKETVRDGMDILSRIPAIAIGKLSVGYSF